MDFEEEFSNKELCKALLDKIHKFVEDCETEIRFMEVCGTHTVALFQTGLRSLLPAKLKHISGPGCPVCVTHEKEVLAFLKLAKENNVILATFGDLIRVPDNKGNTLRNTSFGVNSRLEIVYSPLEALEIAKKEKHKEVIFLGIGFETTAPLIAAALWEAKKENILNFSVFSMHKRVAPALHALLAESVEIKAVPSVDIFLLPGHVAAITGLDYFDFMATLYHKPAVVTGFEPLDIAHSLLLALEQKAKHQAFCVNGYKRVVDNKGNIKAQKLLKDTFKVQSAYWRGLGLIDESGFEINQEFEIFNTLKKFNIVFSSTLEISPCKCGSVLKGHITPTECPLFGKACTPQQPMGPCMVSTEGACAAYYRFL